MKIILFSLFVLGAIYTSAQEIDIKKGKVLFDKKEVVMVDGKKRVYTISDLQNKPIVSIKWNYESLPNGVDEYWFSVTDLATNETNDVVTEGVGRSMSPEKTVVETFSKGEYKLITLNGVDSDVVKSLVSAKKVNYTDVFNAKKDSINSFYSEARNLVDQSNITIDKTGTVSAGKKIIGRVKLQNGYSLVENTDLLVGSVSNKIFTLENGKTYNVNEPSHVFTTIDPNFAKLLVGLALKEGYTLENQIYYKREEEKNKKIADNQAEYQKDIAEAKANSSNLYDVPGYLIDEKGNKITGKLSINFEDATRAVEKSNIESIPENYGKSVFVKAVNEKGKEKSTRYKSNTGAKFCTDSGECYIGLKTIGNVSNAIGNVISLSADFSYYYQILSEDNGYLILKEPASKGLYVKFPNQEKALYVGNNSADKLQKNVNDYTKCNLTVSDFDFDSVDGLKTFIEKYKSTCK